MQAPNSLPTPEQVPFGRHIRSLSLIAAAALPILLLIALLYTFTNVGDTLVGRSSVPADALGRLDIERVAFRPEGIEVTVINSGPAELQISQVFVNDAIWDFNVTPEGELARLERAVVAIPFPWLEAEPHKVSLITSNGLKFETEVAIATATPQPTPFYFAAFALLGLYAGVIPVYLGLLWWPLLRQLSQRWMDFLISLTTGVLIFLGFDVLFEGHELALQVPAPFQGTGLLVIGVALGVGALSLVGRLLGARKAERSGEQQRLLLAYLVAIGIGLHNFGEGLAIGAAYVLGEVVVGALLVIGFTVHNTTEGIAIVGPIARDRRRILHLIGLGAVAGLPTVAGTLIGGLAFSPMLATIFLALGAGAIFFVVIELGRLLIRQHGGDSSRAGGPLTYLGLAVGLLMMYGTALLVSG